MNDTNISGIAYPNTENQDNQLNKSTQGQSSCESIHMKGAVLAASDQSQTWILEKYEQFKHIIKAESNTAAADKAAEV